ncbi:MAG: hypothetical protein FJ308_21595 [Planctomycetes bacterium]|nr:hypothetical protein [Planctomycetota bacterium]
MFRPLIALSMSLALLWGTNSCCCTASHVVSLVGKWFGANTHADPSSNQRWVPLKSCCTANSCDTAQDRTAKPHSKRSSVEPLTARTSVTKPLCCSVDTKTPCGCFHTIILSNERSGFTGPTKADFDELVVWLAPATFHTKASYETALQNWAKDSGLLASLPIRTHLQRWNC